MQKIIYQFIRGSVDGDFFAKALECLEAMREACKVEDEAPQFNNFMYELRG